MITGSTINNSCFNSRNLGDGARTNSPSADTHPRVDTGRGCDQTSSGVETSTMLRKSSAAGGISDRPNCGMLGPTHRPHDGVYAVVALALLVVGVRRRRLPHCSPHFLALVFGCCCGVFSFCRQAAAEYHDFVVAAADAAAGNPFPCARGDCQRYVPPCHRRIASERVAFSFSAGDDRGTTQWCPWSASNPKSPLRRHHHRRTLFSGSVDVVLRHSAL